MGAPPSAAHAGCEDAIAAASTSVIDANRAPQRAVIDGKAPGKPRAPHNEAFH
jgi:hypothetical protein